MKFSTIPLVMGLKESLGHVQSQIHHYYKGVHYQNPQSGISSIDITWSTIGNTAFTEVQYVYLDTVLRFQSTRKSLDNAVG